MESMGRSANLFNRLHASREDLETPEPRGVKAFWGRLLAPLAPHVPVPERAPDRVRHGLLRAMHFAVLARGYASKPLPADPGLRGGIDQATAG
jgi:hypothetical protein